MGLGKALLDFFFPPKCAFCGALLQEGEDGICAACRRDLPKAGEEKLKFDFIPFAAAPFYYEGPVRQALLGYKFQGAPARGRVFGRLVAEELLRRERTDFDVVTWVPLSARRERRRGYDQARILAESVGERLGLRVERMLKKVRHAPPQSRLRTKEARRANISGCFAVSDPDRTAGKRILLIDDIVTTGATVSECARMLMLAGAESVSAAAVACHRDK
ncbi:MAG: ComF family protein [Oscillospiraceae bacterium]|nr:ComF family protein [Oscillospiraceae bacterium]